MSVKDDPDVWPYLPALQDAAARARAMQSEVNQSEASRVASDPSRVAARRSRADTPGAFSGYQDHWDEPEPIVFLPERYTYNSNVRTMLAEVLRIGLTTDGAHHKQWALAQLAHILDFEIQADPGISP